jgi:transposase-like protein
MRTIIDRAVKRLKKKDIDNWSIIINKYSGEKCYELDFKLLKAENKGIVFLSKRDKDNPLIYCTYCQGTHIVKDSYTNIGRRRFKCVDCNRSFVLRGRNLFSYRYVKKQMLVLYLRSFTISKKHILELNSLCNKMAIHFMRESNMAKITKKLQTEFTVSELFRTHEIEIFVTKYSGEYKIVPSKPSEVFKKMTLPSNVFLLPEPEKYVKVLDTVRINKAIEIDLRDYMETDEH